MNLRQLEYFITISETLNYTKAAKKLYVSQTALTKQIQLLEKELNSLLFNRDSKQISLTPAGKFFLKEAKDILFQVNRSQNNFEAYLNGNQGVFRIGFLKNLDPNLLVNIFNNFQKKYPHVTIRVDSFSSIELYQQLEHSKIDIALGVALDKYQNYQKLLISKYPLVVLISKNNPLANKQYLHQDELSNILFDVRKMSDKAPEFEGNLLKIACNQGCAILHAFVKDNCYNEYIKAIPLKPIVEEGIYLIYDPKNQNPIINNFIALI